MATYSGNAANNPTSITIPADNDDLAVLSVAPAFEGLMDKVQHALTGETEFDGVKTFLGVVELAAGMLLGAPIVASNLPAPRTLLLAFPVAANRNVRVYSRASGGTAYPSAGFEITLNAEWDAGPEQWKADLTSAPAYMLDVFDVSVGWSSITNEPNDPATITLRTRATTSSPWAYDDWAGTVLAFNPSNPSATSSAIVANTLYPRNLIKAWGHVRVTGAPGSPAVAFVSTAGMGFGLATVAIDSGTLLITLRRPMASTAYIVVPGMIGQQYIPNLASIVSTTQFRIQFREPASGGGLSAVDPSANNVECSFIVMGVQS